MPSEITVSICSITYNQAPYIRQCLEGFLMQKTSFAFEVLIHDDASTDGTDVIIREYAAKYPDIIKPIFETENQWKKGRIGNLVFNTPRAQGKYLALCEGDDYWIDPLKLQKQVDFLEGHPDYGMCYTDFNIYYQKDKRFEESLFKTDPERFPKRYPTLDSFITHLGYVCPPSWLIRASVMPEDDKLTKSADSSFVLFAFFLVNTKVYALDDVTAVYRILQESASHSDDPAKIFCREKDLLDTQLCLVKKYNLSDETRDKCLESYYRRNLEKFVIYHRFSDVEKAGSVLRHKSMKEKMLLRCDNVPMAFVVKCIRHLRFI